jgi:glycosyltransferase involved in cell wall biosynthesis
MKVGLVINAPNVHQGGGLSLLTAVLDSLDDSFQGCLVLDERMELPDGLSDRIPLHRIRPTILGRLLGEWHLRKWAGFNDVVLCFGNLPPLFKLRAKVFVFVQNRYQVDPRNLREFPLFSRLKITLERFWFAWGKRNVRQYIVQTPSMQRAIHKQLGKPSIILPFNRNPRGHKRTLQSFRDRKHATYDFIYVASGEPHKNHHRLIAAWALLAEDEIRPSLCLTLEKTRFPDLCAWVEHKKMSLNLNITNVGILSNEEIQSLYDEARALIYPSDFETLGLPMIEARCAGLPILASELDYVRDLVDPEQTFDPNSPVSIARAVKRFLGKPERPLPLTDAKTFLAKLLNEVA